MRPGHRDAEMFVADDGIFIGINLGWDFVAEHECGIADLEGDFDVGPPAALGLDRKRINRLPTAELYFEKHPEKDIAYLVYAPKYSDEPMLEWLESTTTRERYRTEHELLTAWDDRKFGIRVQGREAVARLEELHEAFKRLDVTFSVGRGQPFGNGGLNILIYSRIPEDLKEAAREADREQIRLQEAAARTGIVERDQRPEF